MFSIKNVLLLIIIFTVPITNAFFRNIINKNNKNFKISDNEIIETIDYTNVLAKDKKIISKINGFYGIIGPDIDITTTSTLYDLFLGNGNIQGVFFKNGELTFIKYFIRTEKLLFEEKYGKIPKFFMLTGFLMLMDKMIPNTITKIPNTLGVANTAILNIKTKNYALFEQDHPYEIDIDFNRNQINTIGKQKIAKIEHFSAHSKYDIIENKIYTLDYDVLKNSVEYYSMNENFDILNKIKIKTDYIPLIHDFIVLKNNILITDSPIKFKIKKLFNSNIPVSFDKNLSTKIHLINKKNGEIETYISDESFYIFHYAIHRETDNFIEIYAAVYENLDFSKLDIHGRYRKIVLNKKTKKVIIEKNPELEKYNVDFPVKVNNKIILRSLNNNKIDSFLLCEGLDIKKKIFIKDKSICGEPVVAEIDKTPYLISFAYDDLNNGFLLFINLKNFYKIEIPIPHNINIGFHSIFIKNTNIKN